MSNTNDELPKYVQIQKYILAQIKSGGFAPGSKIPTEKELSDQFGTSRITVNKALKELAVTGVVEGIRGKGTFVCKRPRTMTPAGAFISPIKFVPTDADSPRVHRIISFRLMQGPEQLLKKANLNNSAAQFYEIILENEDSSAVQPESLDYIYIPAALVSKNILSTLDYLCTHFVFDYLRAQLELAPQFMKIFVNLPLYPFLESAPTMLNTSDHTLIWCTDIYDSGMQMLSSIYTVYREKSQEIPLFTFAL